MTQKITSWQPHHFTTNKTITLSNIYENIDKVVKSYLSINKNQCNYDTDIIYNSFMKAIYEFEHVSIFIDNIQFVNFPIIFKNFEKIMGSREHEYDHKKYCEYVTKNCSLLLEEIYCKSLYSPPPHKFLSFHSSCE